MVCCVDGAESRGTTGRWCGCGAWRVRSSIRSSSRVCPVRTRRTTGWNGWGYVWDEHEVVPYGTKRGVRSVCRQHLQAAVKERYGGVDFGHQQRRIDCRSSFTSLFRQGQSCHAHVFKKEFRGLVLMTGEVVRVDRVRSSRSVRSFVFFEFLHLRFARGGASCAIWKKKWAEWLLVYHVINASVGNW